MFPSAVAASAADVLATVWDASSLSETLALARALREAGLRVEVYPDADKLGKQMKYAASRSIRFAIIVGDDERVNETVAVKDLTSGTQSVVPRADVAQRIRALLASGT
jgi:histidyl-tRNA synthetase